MAACTIIHAPWGSNFFDAAPTKSGIVRMFPARRADCPQQPALPWPVNAVEAAIDAVRSGLRYGWLPRHLIARERARGELLALPLATGQR